MARSGALRVPTRVAVGLSLVVGLLADRPARSAERRADVAVYGASAGGVIAAVSAARMGKSVVLVEPGRHVGGMVSGGLGATDFGNRGAIGGTSREFFRRVREHYVAQHGPASEQVRDCTDGYHFEPHVADALFRKMLDETRVVVVLDAPLRSVERASAGIRSIRVGDDTVTATVFIDASYEGDLMAAAGVRWTAGREGREQYGESIAGVQARSPAHQWPGPVPGLDAAGKPLPAVEAGPIAPAGSGDDLIQAYNYRLCMTDRAANRVPFPKPEGYDPARYELLARYLASKPGLKVGQLMNPVRMPNGKTDTNNNGPFSTDHIGGNRDYIKGDAATRAAIVRDHYQYVAGFLYFLANDPRVPAPLHDEMARWGLARDEFGDTDHWPHQLYVREGRRMLGAFVMTQADIMRDRSKPDSVGLGSYNTDSHHVQRVALPDGTVLNEGDFQVGVQPYAIPYRSLTPKLAECPNLLVPVCMSASHVAYGTVRMEPVYMILGQACGVAAGLAIDGKTPVQEVPIAALQAQLRATGAILDPTEVPGSKGPAGNPAALDPAKLGGIVVDDEAAETIGDWAPSRAIGPYVGVGYRHDGGRADPTCRVRFVPRIPAAGRYEVRLYSTPNPNRATNVRVVVRSVDGERTVAIDQRRGGADGRPIPLGVYDFAAGDGGWAEVRSAGADGHVIADAVQFIPAP